MKIKYKLKQTYKKRRQQGVEGKKVDMESAAKSIVPRAK
jgi:hypothetical protein